MATPENVLARTYVTLKKLVEDLAGQNSSLGTYSPLAVNAFEAASSALEKLEVRIKSIIAANPSDPIIRELEFLT